MCYIEHGHGALRIVCKLGRAIVEEHLLRVVHDMKRTVAGTGQGRLLAILHVAVPRGHQSLVPRDRRRRMRRGRNELARGDRLVYPTEIVRSAHATFDYLLELLLEFVPRYFKSFLSRSVF